MKPLRIRHWLYPFLTMIALVTVVGVVRDGPSHAWRLLPPATAMAVLWWYYRSRGSETDAFERGLAAAGGVYLAVSREMLGNWPTLVLLILTLAATWVAFRIEASAQQSAR